MAYADWLCPHRWLRYGLLALMPFVGKNDDRQPCRNQARLRLTGTATKSGSLPPAAHCSAHSYGLCNGFLRHVLGTPRAVRPVPQTGRFDYRSKLENTRVSASWGLEPVHRRRSSSAGLWRSIRQYVPWRAIPAG